jgi:hypothetical protein
MVGIKRVIVATISIVAVIILSIFVVLIFEKETLFNLYADRLDRWVEAGGNVERLDAEVVPSCGKLVMTQSGVWKDLGFVTLDRAVFHFEVGVCVKLTMNRLVKQPEVENPEMIMLICAGSNDLLRHLCKRSGLATPG